MIAAPGCPCSADLRTVHERSWIPPVVIDDPLPDFGWQGRQHFDSPGSGQEYDIPLSRSCREEGDVRLTVREVAHSWDTVPTEAEKKPTPEIGYCWTANRSDSVPSVCTRPHDPSPARKKALCGIT